MNKKRIRTINWYVVVLIIFSTLMIIPFLHVGQLGVHSDWSFHSARVQQIYLNLKRGHLITYIGTDTFSKVGNANFIFYPTLFLYPWAILKLLFAPITAYLMYVWMMFVVTSLIAFYCMQSFNKDNSLESFYFSLVYTIVPYHLYLTLSNYVLGEAQAYMFIPIVFLGIYKVLYRKQWVTLSVGMALMAYSHYVSLFISAEICFLIFIIYLIQKKKITKDIIFGLIKSVLLFFMLSLGQFAPLYTDLYKANLVGPTPGFMLMQTAGSYVVSALNNDALNQGGIGLLLLITLLFGWEYINKNSVDMWIYIIGLLLVVMITSVFPWQYFTKTPLAIIQFPYRYTSYAAFFLSIILAKGLVKLNFNNLTNECITGIICFVALLLFAGSIYSDVARNKGIVPNTSVLRTTRKGGYRTFRNSSDSPIIINNNTYNYQFNYGALYGETDYMPRAAFNNAKSVLNRNILINDKVKSDKHSLKAKPNKLIYTVNTSVGNKIDLPILAYNDTRVKLNGATISHKVSERGTVEVNSKNRHNIIEITYCPSILFNLCRIVSLVSFMVLVVWQLIIKYVRK